MLNHSSSYCAILSLRGTKPTTGYHETTTMTTSQPRKILCFGIQVGWPAAQMLCAFVTTFIVTTVMLGVVFFSSWNSVSLATQVCFHVLESSVIPTPPDSHHTPTPQLRSPAAILIVFDMLVLLVDFVASFLPWSLVLIVVCLLRSTQLVFL